MTQTTQSTSMSQTASVMQTTSSGQGSLLGFGVGAATSNLFNLNWPPFAPTFNRPSQASNVNRPLLAVPPHQRRQVAPQ